MFIGRGGMNHRVIGDSEPRGWLVTDVKSPYYTHLPAQRFLMLMRVYSLVMGKQKAFYSRLRQRGGFA